MVKTRYVSLFTPQSWGLLAEDTLRWRHERQKFTPTLAPIIPSLGICVVLILYSLSPFSVCRAGLYIEDISKNVIARKPAPAKAGEAIFVIDLA